MPLMPPPGYATRMRRYLAEMYPLHLRLPAAALLVLGFDAMLRRIHAVAGGWLTPHVLLGIWTIFMMYLVLRLMDELKDREVDLRLFRDRPLPSGRVLEADIAFSLALAVLLAIVPNLWTPGARVFLLVVLGWALLMFRWFFVPDIMRPNLLLTLATHNPIIPLLLLYLVFLFAAEHRLHPARLLWGECALLVAMFWGMSLAWEIARKIRAPEEENEYVTYSRLLGRHGAVAVAAGAQTVTLAIGLWLWGALQLPWAYGSLLLGGWIAAMAGHARFVLKPSAVTSKLRPFAETYLLCVMAAAVAGCALGN